MNARDTKRPHPRRVRSKPVKPSRRSGGGGSKGGVCSFSLPSAAAATAVALSLLVLVRWQVGGAR